MQSKWPRKSPMQNGQKQIWWKCGLFLEFSWSSVLCKCLNIQLPGVLLPFLGIPGLSEITSCERFERLCKYFHVNDTTNNLARQHPGHDKLCHIRPILDTVLEKCFIKNLFHQNWSTNNENIQFYKPRVNIYILFSQPFWCCSIHPGNKHQ